MVAWSAPTSLTMENQVTGDPVNMDAAGDTIAVVLLKSTYTYSVTHEDAADLVLASNEVSGDQYTQFVPGTAREQLAGQLITLDSPSAGQVKWDATDHVFAVSGTGFTDARHIIICHEGATEALSRIILHADLGSDFGNVAGSLTLQWNVNGLINWTGS